MVLYFTFNSNPPGVYFGIHNEIKFYLLFAQSSQHNFVNLNPTLLSTLLGHGTTFIGNTQISLRIRSTFLFSILSIDQLLTLMPVK